MYSCTVIRFFPPLQRSHGRISFCLPTVVLAALYFLPHHASHCDTSEHIWPERWFYFTAVFLRCFTILQSLCYE